MAGNVMPMMVPKVCGQQQMVDPSEAIPRVCDKCKGEHFDKVYRRHRKSGMGGQGFAFRGLPPFSRSRGMRQLCGGI